MAQSAEVAEIVQAHARTVDSLKAALHIVDELNHPSLSVTLMRAIHDEVRRARAVQKGSPAVARALLSKNAEEQRLALVSRQQAQEDWHRNAQNKKMKRDLHELENKAKKARLALRELQGLQECNDALKTWSPEMLGFGHLRGGGANFVKRRMEVMDRIAAQADSMSAQQKNDWEWFKEQWDSKNIEQHGKDWGKVFAETMNGLMHELKAGRTSAVADFMYKESKRLLNDIPVLRC